MLENFIFENHLGQRFIGSENGVYLNYNDLRDYEWKYDTINGKISRFYQDISEKSLPLIVINKSKEASIKAKNLLLELSEVDIEAMLPGKIYIGEYYINGYVTASKKSNYLINSRYCSMGLTFTCNNPTWYKEQTQVSIPESEDTSGSGYGFEYPYDYKYDYPSPNKGKTIFCDSIRSNSFRMRIFGEITNPTVIINGHRYTVNCKVGKNENIVIDSLNKTIIKNLSDGGKENCFDYRSREDYIFEPISPGENTIAWNGSFGFNLTIIEERSEPKWT